MVVPPSKLPIPKVTDVRLLIARVAPTSVELLVVPSVILLAASVKPPTGMLIEYSFFLVSPVLTLVSTTALTVTPAMSYVKPAVEDVPDDVAVQDLDLMWPGYVETAVAKIDDAKIYTHFF